MKIEIVQVPRRPFTSRAADWLDGAAVAGSFACMLHCLALPLALTMVPALSAVLAVPESFHVWMLAFTVPAAGIALVQGEVRHRAGYPLALGVVGLVLLLLALLARSTSTETLVTVAGSLTLAGAHISNWRLRER